MSKVPLATASPSHVPLPRTVRTSQALAVGIAVLGTVTMVLLGFTAHRTGAQIFSWVFAVLLVVAGVRAAACGVCIQQGGVRIRGVLATRTLKWSEIESFSFGPLGIFPAVGIVHVKTGRPLPITGISVAPVATTAARSHAQTLIADLNDALRRYGGGTSSA